ncbi:hypothetical protein BACSP_03592 [Bacillus sp. T2.9-1]|nr:hypothetical protein BACSP_03592 [Bacillus sp. T2.9-1]
MKNANSFGYFSKALFVKIVAFNYNKEQFTFYGIILKR